MASPQSRKKLPSAAAAAPATGATESAAPSAETVRQEALRKFVVESRQLDKDETPRDRAAAEAFLAEVGRSPWAESFRTRNGHHPRMRTTGWPVDMLDGVQVSLENGARVPRSEVV